MVYSNLHSKCVYLLYRISCYTETVAWIACSFYFAYVAKFVVTSFSKLYSRSHQVARQVHIASFLTYFQFIFKSNVLHQLHENLNSIYLWGFLWMPVAIRKVFGLTFHCFLMSRDQVKEGCLNVSLRCMDDYQLSCIIIGACSLWN